MTAVRVRHAFECFYSTINMFNNNTPFCQSFVIRFFLFGQLMVLTALYRDTTVRMVVRYPLVSKIGVNRDGIAHRFPYRLFVQLKIMLAAFRFLHVNNLQAAPLNYYLRFYRVPFFLPE